jgi:hypothetical protein
MHSGCKSRCGWDIAVAVEGDYVGLLELRQKLHLGDTIFAAGRGILAYDFGGHQHGRMNRPDQSRPRKIAARVCLVAVIFLYAPLVGTAWTARTMDCCNGQLCNIAQHHHKNARARQSGDSECGHDVGAMTACSMSCCQDMQRPMLTAVVFVVPQVATRPSDMQETGALDITRTIELPRSVEPPSPPPRVVA